MLFALLPGAGCEPWIWDRVIPELRQRGHDAIGVRLPYDGAFFRRQPARRLD